MGATTFCCHIGGTLSCLITCPIAAGVEVGYVNDGDADLPDAGNAYSAERLIARSTTLRFDH